MSETPPDNKARKPGFFSRLFTAKQTETPPESVAAADSLPAGLDQAPPELDPADQAAASVVEPTAPAAEATAPAVDSEQPKTFWGRWFGKKEQPAAAPPETQPVATTPPEAPTEPTTIAAEGVEEVAVAAGEEPSESWFDRLRTRLRRGSGSFVGAIRNAVGLSGRLDDETVERLEEILIAADVGMDTALKIVEQLRKRARQENAEGTDAIMKLFQEVLQEVFEGNVKPFEPQLGTGEPYVVMVVGVNGVGKTTTIGKIAKRCRDAGLKVMLVAGDTFRAAAIEQLEIWAKRTGSEFMKSKQGSDPSGLAYDALRAAKANGIDVVLFDTAGRLQTKANLMEELGKIARVCKKVIPDAPHDTLLVIDATTGQNAVNQVRAFTAITPLSGLVMTKLDGTAKGGVLITIRDQFDVPVTLIGVGEGVDDLRDFDPEQFAAALFSEDKGKKS